MSKKAKPLPSFERVNELLRLDEETGQLFWKISPSNNVKIGSESGYLDKDYGYIRVAIDDERYLAHRLVWLLHTGDDPGQWQIDHINGNRIDNRPCNLRLVTHQQNSHNLLSAKGFYFNKSTGKWLAQIQIDGKRKYLGYYDCPNEARSAYLAAKEIYHVIPVNTIEK